MNARLLTPLVFAVALIAGCDSGGLGEVAPRIYTEAATYRDGDTARVVVHNTTNTDVSILLSNYSTSVYDKVSFRLEKNVDKEWKLSGCSIPSLYSASAYRLWIDVRSRRKVNVAISRSCFGFAEGPGRYRIRLYVAGPKGQEFSEAQSLSNEFDVIE